MGVVTSPLEEIPLCGCSPYTLIMGRLWKSPAKKEELDNLARMLYVNRRSCWSYEDYRVVMGFLLHSGMVKEDSNGMLTLDLEDPYDADYAKLALESCRQVYDLVGGGN